MFLLHHLQSDQERLVRDAESYLDERLSRACGRPDGWRARPRGERRRPAGSCARGVPPAAREPGARPASTDGARADGRGRGGAGPPAGRAPSTTPTGTVSTPAPAGPALPRRACAAPTSPTPSSSPSGRRPGPETTRSSWPCPASGAPSALGLLLSVARAAGLPVAGLVDAAVAAASLGHRRRRRCLHLDLTRHRAVVTALRRRQRA